MATIRISSGISSRCYNSNNRSESNGICSELPRPRWLEIIISWRGYTIALYACIALALTVVIGNTASPAHVHLMTTFLKPASALILIIGGYVLQGVLIYTSCKKVMLYAMVAFFTKLIVVKNHTFHQGNLIINITNS